MKKRELFITITAIALLVSCGKSEDDKQKALEAMKGHEYGIANVILKDLVSSNPNDLNLRRYLAESELFVGDYASAEKNLKPVYQSDASKEILELWVEALYRNESYLELLRVVDNAESNSAKISYYQAMSLRKAGRVPESVALLGEVTELEKPFSDLASAVLLADEGFLKEAIAKVESAGAHFESVSEADWLKVQFLSLSDRHKESAEELQAYLLVKNKDSRARLFYALELIKSRQYEDAAPIIDRFFTKNKNSAYLNEMKGILDLNLKGSEAALPYLMNAYQLGRRSSELALTIAKAAFDSQQYETAYRFLSFLDNEQSDYSDQIRALKIRVALKLGYSDEALAVLEKSKGRNYEIDSSIVAEIGSKLKRQGHEKEADDLIHDFLSSRSSSNSSFYLNESGRSEASIDEVKSLLESPNISTDEKKVLQIVSFILNDNLNEAYELSKNWSKVASGDYKETSLEFAAFTATQTERVEEAKNYFETLIEINPMNLLANLYFIEPLIEKGDWSSVENKLAALAEKYSTNEKVLRLYFDSQFLHGESESSVKLLRKNHEKNDDLRSATSLAYALFMKKNYDGVLTVLSPFVKGINPSAEFLRYYVYSFTAKGNMEDVIKSLVEWREIFPKNTNLSAHLIYLLEAQSRLDEAIVIVDELMLEYKNDSRLQLIKANLLVKQNRPDEAALTLGRVPKELRVTEAYKIVQGKVLFAQKEYEQAFDIFSKVGAQNMDASTVLYFAYTLSVLKKSSQAFEILRDFLKREPENLVILSALADGVKSTNPKEAISLYKEILKLDKENIVALNNIAYLLLESGEIKLGKSYVEQALKLRGEEPFIVDTAARIFFANGEKERASDLFSTLLRRNNSIGNHALFCNFLIDTLQNSEQCTGAMEKKFGKNEAQAALKR